MALVATGFELVVSLADTGDNRTNRTYDMVEAAYADAAADAAALVAALAAISDATVVGYSLNQKFTENAFATPTRRSISSRSEAVNSSSGKSFQYS